MGFRTFSCDGHIGVNGAELKTTKSGKPFVRFSLANNIFINGEEKTEWFDVTSYDPFVIESKYKLLTKGAYVAVSGIIRSEARIKDNKVYLNQYITADRVELLSAGRKENNVQDIAVTGHIDPPELSVYTKDTQPKAKQFEQSNNDFMAQVNTPADDDLPF